MLIGLFIFLDDEFDAPVYADPAPADVEPVLFTAACEAVSDALEDEREAHGVITTSETHIAWLCYVKQGVSFVALVSDDVKGSDVEKYLANLGRRYMDQVDDPRNPERDGVDDVVVDVIPPWEDEEDD